MPRGRSRSRSRDGVGACCGSLRPRFLELSFHWVDDLQCFGSIFYKTVSLGQAIPSSMGGSRR